MVGATVACGVVVSAPAAPVAASDKLPVRAFVVGDSLTVGCQAVLKTELSRSIRSVAVDSRVGRATGEGIAHLRSQASKRADIWVVALGTNDAPSARVMRSNVRTVLRMAGRRQVIWLTVVRPGGYSAVNQELRRLDRDYERLTVLDWASYVHKHHSLLVNDGVHLTSTGYRIRASQISRTVKHISVVTLKERESRLRGSAAASAAS